ncbi:MAG: hypothetical protein A2066_07350 [Bacteroidetes bacterium GWB2_41_8]|nr:MAG: hypothetical protein A2066_07350 [Bacteroidetes bacterium GWB2_41_8]
MDIQTLKINLARKILDSNKPSVLEKVEEILKSEGSEDWWYELPVEIQEAIQDGLKQAESGNLLTHEQVVHEARTKYGF